jgi:NADH-quinone oxidoreductase subunit C
MPFEATCNLLTARFGAENLTTSEFRDNRRIHIAPQRVFEVLCYLKEEAGFNQLAELGAADYLNYPGARDRFGLWYVLVNITTGERVVIKTFLNEPNLAVASVFVLWKGADWMEREVFDMYGIIFTGHPDLRRILMPEEFTSYPLRKDYPLRGRGERHNFPVLTRAES